MHINILQTSLIGVSLGIVSKNTPTLLPWSMKACLRASDGVLGTGTTYKDKDNISSCLMMRNRGNGFNFQSMFKGQALPEVVNDEI